MHTPRKTFALGAALLALGGLAGPAQASPVSIPVLIQRAVYRSARPRYDLALPAQPYSDLPNALDMRIKRPAEVDGVFFGPMYMSGKNAVMMRRAMSTMPAPLRKLMTSPVGPWGMNAESIGYSWHVGLGTYVRF